MKTVYYRDPLGDDFAGMDIQTETLPADFPFARSSLPWRILSWLVYYCIAIPLVFLCSKLYLGLKIKNRRALKPLRRSGYFLYGNHTRALDAFTPAMAAFPKAAFVTCSPDAVSIPGLRRLVQMLGGLPIPRDLAPMRGFLRAVEQRFSEKRCIAIFPEAHIWPFYTGIRPFPDASFRYPVNLDAPVVAMVTTYRRRRGLFFWCRRPGMTVELSEAFYPDKNLPRRQAQKKLRDQVYSFMCSRAAAPGNVEYIRYIQLSEDGPHPAQ